MCEEKGIIFLVCSLFTIVPSIAISCNKENIKKAVVENTFKQKTKAENDKKRQEEIKKQQEELAKKEQKAKEELQNAKKS
ncbi:hypothetical protein [Mycoplasma phocimorsus]|uniref:hypothetical protein n=1 Tax=Mycoplasma phocimorsus TaxID=3045839 RepID=UPI0024BF9EA6|nr:hypothetical protein [Mycoplasma phocimorsus]MDJ1646462.1 hypothetical protein [Mycoplasma phocimorsus]MDJ1648872.1 hypothetical protein [Mycoplasma phocimorsus]